MRFLLIAILIIVPFLKDSEKTKETDSEIIETSASRIVIDTLSFSLKNLDLVLQHYDVAHRDIVIRQFILETGWGKSYSFRKRNNLFGLYDSRNHRYFSFKHWSESVKGYKNSVQYKYGGGNYYEFLRKLPYAMDPNYINKLQDIKYDIQ